ncbi:MAG: integrin alpha, partial [Planctomycetota bacterium]|nr:integrin alpha [Planctomycetota bacterium]
SGAKLFTLKGGPGEDGLGTTLDAAGDVDGDGTPDLVVGAPADQRYLPGRLGTAWVFSGKTGAALYEWPAAGNLNGTQGWAVAGAGDVNLDGYDDVVVTEEGYGQVDTYVRTYSGFDGSVLRELSAPHWNGFGL